MDLASCVPLRLRCGTMHLDVGPAASLSASREEKAQPKGAGGSLRADTVAPLSLTQPPVRTSGKPVRTSG